MRKPVGMLAVLALAQTTLAADVTKTARLTQDASKPFAIENLAGTMHVAPGTGPTAEVVATLHAESPAVLEAMGFEATTDDKGRPSLRVRYPHGENRIRYPRPGQSNSDVEYDGHRVRVSSDSGVVAWADLEVRLPKNVSQAWIKNGVGALTASGVSGNIKFDTAEGDITVSDVDGDILADTGSGDVKATNLRGRFKCDTGSGDCDVTGFRGDTLSLDTGTGDLKVTGAQAEEIRADTGTGDVDVEATGAGFRSLKADTGSGDVRLRLAVDASFEARADLGSGDITSGFADAEPILKHREVVGYRRGDGRIKIEVDTGSGDVVLEPAR